MNRYEKTLATQWIATYIVAAELARRGYKIGWPTGNAPIKDLYVESPRGELFYVDVKGGRFSPTKRDGSPRAYCYLVQKGRFAADPDHLLYFVFVAIPAQPDEDCDCAILSHQELLDEDKKAQGTGAKRDGTPYAAFSPGIDWRTLKSYVGKWCSLPG